MNLELTNITNQLKKVLDDALSLNGRTKLWRNQTKLYGNIPELDCIIAMYVIIELNAYFEINMIYEDFNSDVFATMETLINYIMYKKRIKNIASGRYLI